MPDEEKDLALSSPPIPELTEAGEASLAEVASAVTGTPVESQETTPGDTSDDTADTGAEESSSSESEETPEFLTLDPANISQSISALITENSEFANIFASRVGQAAATKYQPQIEQLTSDLAAERGQQLVTKYDGMTDEDRGKAFTNAPQLASQYAAAKEAIQNPSAVSSMQELRTSILELSGMALEKGMPQEKLDEFLKKADDGGYDLDEQGNPYKSWTGPYHSLQREVMGALLDARPSVVSESPEVSKGKPADTASPDLGPSRRTSNNDSPAKYTMAEVRAMNPEQQFEAFGDTPGAVEEAIRKGIVTDVSDATNAVLGLT